MPASVVAAKPDATAVGPDSTTLPLTPLVTLTLDVNALLTKLKLCEVEGTPV